MSEQPTPGVSRRAFLHTAGKGSVAVGALAWSAPKVTTLAADLRASGSPRPGGGGPSGGPTTTTRPRVLGETEHEPTGPDPTRGGPTGGGPAVRGGTEPHGDVAGHQLAFTGFDAEKVGRVGGAAILTGGAMVLGARQKSRHDHFDDDDLVE